VGRCPPCNLLERSMFSSRTRFMDLLLVPVAWMFCLFVAGCGDGIGTRYPVEARVLVDGEPLTGMTGKVIFVPDKDKGNKTPVNAGGDIDAEGRYKLSTKGKPGAPAGWYKVVVSAVPPGTDDRDVNVQPVI